MFTTGLDVPSSQEFGINRNQTLPLERSGCGLPFPHDRDHIVGLNEPHRDVGNARWKIDSWVRDSSIAIFQSSKHSG